MLLGFLAHAKGSFEEASEHFTLSLSYYTTLGDDFACATVANQIGICARERGEYPNFYVCEIYYSIIYMFYISFM
jgi:hypothetical protein